MTDFVARNCEEVAALEAHARLRSALQRRLHLEDVFPLDRERLLDDHVLAGANRGDELAGVLVRIAGDVDHPDAGSASIASRFECTRIGQPCRSVSSAASSGRDE